MSQKHWSKEKLVQYVKILSKLKIQLCNFFHKQEGSNPPYTVTSKNASKPASPIFPSQTGMAEVKLHGFWCSPFSYRVEWALKLKGVEYEYIEEDLSNKSEDLLKYNPVYKQVPVLVHGGKPIAESLVILEYIEETWAHNPLLPKDPYERAMARFWMQYGVTKGATPFALFHASNQEEKEKAANEVIKALKVLEERALGDAKYFGGDTLNLVDLSYGLFTHWFVAIEDVVGLKVLEPSKLPGFCAWVKNFKEHPVIKEKLPDYDQMLAYMTGVQQKFAIN